MTDAEPVLVHDGHAHVASADFIPRAFFADVAANMCRRLQAETGSADPDRVLDALIAQHQDHHADRFVAEMDAAGVARAVLLIPDFGLRMDGTPPMSEMVRRHHEIRLRHPGRFWVYAGVDPRRGPAGVEDFVDTLDRYGCDGIKLYPPCGYSPSDDGMFPYYDICRERGLPVFVHTGPTAGSLAFEPAHPLGIDRAAREFPTVAFVLGHGGVTHVDVCAYLAAYRPNVYIDIGGFAGAAFPGGWPAHLNRLFRLGLNHKIIFGTDAPLNRMSGGLKRLVAEVVHGPVVFDGVRRRERDMILSGNLLRVLASATVGAA
jgi:predicted TIM-barrel fold metal-dependent hydrolase